MHGASELDGDRPEDVAKCEGVNVRDDTVGARGLDAVVCPVVQLSCQGSFLRTANVVANV